MKLHPKFIMTAAVLVAIVTPARATITMSVDAEEILQGGLGSNPAAAGSLVLFVADTTGAGFNALQNGPITVGSMIDHAGNDLVVAQFSISAGTFLTNNQPFLAGSLNNISLTGGWHTGQPLAIYWIPTLTTANSNVGTGVAYGKYTDPTGLDSSIPWVTPSDPGTYNPMLFSTDGFFGTGTNAPASTGYSSLSTVAVVPEPSTFAFLGGVVGLAVSVLYRRKSLIAPVVRLPRSPLIRLGVTSPGRFFDLEFGLAGLLLDVV